MYLFSVDAHASCLHVHLQCMCAFMHVYVEMQCMQHVSMHAYISRYPQLNWIYVNYHSRRWGYQQERAFQSFAQFKRVIVLRLVHVNENALSAAVQHCSVAAEACRTNSNWMLSCVCYWQRQHHFSNQQLRSHYLCPYHPWDVCELCVPQVRFQSRALCPLSCVPVYDVDYIMSKYGWECGS